MPAGRPTTLSRLGIYTALARHAMGWAARSGFEEVRSRHLVTNTAIIQAKLRPGFVVTGMEVTDVHGVMVRMTWLPSEVRQEGLQVRSGAAAAVD